MEVQMQTNTGYSIIAMEEAKPGKEDVISER